MRSRRSPSQLTAALPSKNDRADHSNNLSSRKAAAAAHHQPPPPPPSGNIINSQEPTSQKLPKVEQLATPLPSVVFAGNEQQLPEFRGNSYFSCAELRELEVLCKLGEGAFSSVYRVRRLRDGKEYALKRIKMAELTPKERENAISEVQFLASIHSKHVVAYKQAIYDEQRGQLCVLMEFAEGGDLSKVIRRATKSEKYIDENTVWIYISHIARGLKALHDLKVLHRDLKAANILLDKTQTRALLGDLNVSKKLKPDGLLYTQTGTPYYASPEVWSDTPYNAKSDIWSFGCLIYELCALKPPFTAPDMEKLSKKIQKGVYDPIPPLYSKELGELIGNMIKVQPEGRPSCGDILKIIRQQSRINNENSFQESPRKSEFYQSEQQQQLLSTIRVGKTLEGLTEKLPAARYDPSPLKTQSEELTRKGLVSMKQQPSFQPLSQQISETRGRVSHHRVNSESLCLNSSMTCNQDTNNNNNSSAKYVHSCEGEIEERNLSLQLKQRSIQSILQKQQILSDQRNNLNKDSNQNPSQKKSKGSNQNIYLLSEQSRQLSKDHPNQNQNQNLNSCNSHRKNKKDISDKLVSDASLNSRNNERVKMNPISQNKDRERHQSTENLSQENTVPYQLPKRLYTKQLLKKLPNNSQHSPDQLPNNLKQQYSINHQSSLLLPPQTGSPQKQFLREREAQQVPGSLKNRCCSVDYKKSLVLTNNPFIQPREFSQMRINEENNLNNNSKVINNNNNSKNLDNPTTTTTNNNNRSRLTENSQPRIIGENENVNFISQEDLQITRKRKEIHSKQVFQQLQQSQQNQGYLLQIQPSVKPNLDELSSKGSNLHQVDLFRHPMNFNSPAESLTLKNQDSSNILQRILDAKIRKKDPRNKSMHFSSARGGDQTIQMILHGRSNSQHHAQLLESPLQSIDEHSDFQQQRAGVLVSQGKGSNQRETQGTNSNHQTLPRIFMNKMKPRRQSIKYINDQDSQFSSNNHMKQQSDSTNDSTPALRQPNSQHSSKE